MGAPMARNLLKAGFQVRVWNRTPDKARVLAAEGADLAETPADAVREAAFVITIRRRGPGGDGAGGGVGAGRRRLAPDQHGRYGRGARGRARGGPRDHVRGLSR